MGTSILRGAACAVVLLLGGHAAHAIETETPRFRLDYDASPGCPDRAAFVTAIRARTPRPRLADDSDSEPAIMLRVAIESGAASSSGRLDLREPDGTAETRNVTSRTCAEVADALALVAAVMLDPDARSGEQPPAATASAPPIASTPPPAATPKARPKPSPRPAPSASRPTWRWSAGGGIGILSGIGPAIAPSLDAFVDVERDHRALASTARLSIDVARTSSDVRDGTQTYEWLAATLRVCPAYLSLRYRLRVAPCAALQVGGHRGTTSDVLNPTAGTDLWLAPVLGGSLDWAASSSVTLELQGGAVFPLRRTRFFLAPDTTIFSIPVVAATAGLGVRVRFL